MKNDQSNQLEQLLLPGGPRSELKIYECERCRMLSPEKPRASCMQGYANDGCPMVAPELLTKLDRCQSKPSRAWLSESFNRGAQTLGEATDSAREMAASLGGNLLTAGAAPIAPLEPLTTYQPVQVERTCTVVIPDGCDQVQVSDTASGEVIAEFQRTPGVVGDEMLTKVLPAGGPLLGQEPCPSCEHFPGEPRDNPFRRCVACRSGA